jgi:hypothetical protein
MQRRVYIRVQDAQSRAFQNVVHSAERVHQHVFASRQQSRPTHVHLVVAGMSSIALFLDRHVLLFRLRMPTTQRYAECFKSALLKVVTLSVTRATHRITRIEQQRYTTC